MRSKRETKIESTSTSIDDDQKDQYSGTVNRRNFLRISALLAGAGVLSTSDFTGITAAKKEDSRPQWDEEADEIIEQIEEPTFPGRTFPVTKYNAVGNGKVDDSAAFEKAIEACTEAGGGKVIVPGGVYFHAGPIHLDDNVNLHLTPNATIRFSTDPVDYLPPIFSRWQGVELMNYSPLIYAYGKKNIAVTGSGTLDAQANNENWWWMAPIAEDDAFPELVEMMEDGVPPEERVFGEESVFRPPCIQTYNCEKVFFEGITVIDSPFWLINPVLCKHVTAKDLKLDSPEGPNNDGFNPESCNYVLVEDCFFNNGDDCVAIKSGRNEDGQRISEPTENVIVQDCEMRNGHGGFVVGSEMSGGARSLYARRNTLDSPNLDRVVRIKTNSTRGGFVEDYYFWNSEINEVGQAHIRLNLDYGAAQVGDSTGNFPPKVRNINIGNMMSGSSTKILDLTGIKESPIEDIAISDSSFSKASLGSWNQYIRDSILSNVRVGETPGPWSTDLLELTGPSYDIKGDINFKEVSGPNGTYFSEGDPYLEAVEAKAGVECFVARNYKIEEIPPALAGGTLIRGANADISLTSEQVAEYISFETNYDITTHVAFDPRGEGEWWPDWLDGWKRTDMEIPVSYGLSHVIFKKNFKSGEIVLQPNSSNGGGSSYFTIVTEQTE